MKSRPAESWSISIAKDYLKFSAAHFLIFPDGTAERLHGHNYKVFVDVHTDLNEHGLVVNFKEIKPLVREVCDELDEHLVRLLSERAKCALDIGHEKRAAGLEIESENFLETMLSEDGRLAMKTYVDLPFKPGGSSCWRPVRIQTTASMVLLNGLHHRGDCRTRIALVFETRKAFADFRCGVVKTSRQAGGFEGLGDLTHLAHIAPCLGYGDGGGPTAFFFQRGLRNAPFIEERVVHSLVFGVGANRQNQSVGAFRPGCVRHF